MKSIISFSVLAATFILAFSAYAAPGKIGGLYVNSFGNKSNPAVVFVHGGPGYDSQDFEFSTAALLASKGFYVVVYDQRGQGRSDLAQAPSDYGYKQYADDLNLIISTLGLTQPALIGHSHGGPISLKFDQFYPGVVSKIILVSAPVDFFKSLDSIRINCTARYSAVGDTVNLNKLNSAFTILNSQPSIENEIGAVAEVFQLGAQKPCELYTPSKPTQEAMNLHAKVRSLHVAVPQENLFYPMGNFVINEQYIHADQTQWVKNNAVHIFGIYGSEDGLFTPGILSDIQSSLSTNPKSYRFQLISGASHAVYIDQQANFIDAILQDLK
ncbi:MAG: alpha/beta hydrolase [Pseudobdellovibrionaceae bacterium]